MNSNTIADHDSILLLAVQLFPFLPRKLVCPPDFESFQGFLQFDLHLFQRQFKVLSTKSQAEAVGEKRPEVKGRDERAAFHWPIR